MPVSDSYLDYILEQFEPIGPVIYRKMFGGAGLYMNGLFFAILADDCLYFKVDDHNRQDFLDAGMGPFQPFKDKKTVMKYYEVPVEVIEDSGELKRWSNKALHAAAHAK